MDATGYDGGYVSQYYVRRRGDEAKRRKAWPKLTVACDVETHLWLAAEVSLGPSQDSPDFQKVVPLASMQACIEELSADAAYDAEHNHRLCREDLKIKKTVIPLNPRGQPPEKVPKGRYRREMHESFDEVSYRSRLASESSFSQDKRVFGSSLRCRRTESQLAELRLRVVTHNIALLAAM